MIKFKKSICVLLIGLTLNGCASLVTDSYDQAEKFYFGKITNPQELTNEGLCTAINEYLQNDAEAPEILINEFKNRKIEERPGSKQIRLSALLKTTHPQIGMTFSEILCMRGVYLNINQNPIGTTVNNKKVITMFFKKKKYFYALGKRTWNFHAPKEPFDSLKVRLIDGYVQDISYY